MTVETTAESRIFVSPTAMARLIAPESDIAASLAEFSLIDDWIEIDEVEDLGEIGDEASDVTFAAIKNGRNRHMKGIKDAGTLALVCGHDPLDVGQLQLVACEGTKYNYPFKIEVADAPDEAYSNTTAYFLGKVMSKRLNLGTVDNVTRRTFNIGINTALFERVASMS